MGNSGAAMGGMKEAPVTVKDCVLGIADRVRYPRLMDKDLIAH